MKRIIALFLVALLAISLVSCSPRDTIKLTVRQSIISDEDAALQKKTISEFEKAFEKKYPDINIEIEYVKEFPVDFKEIELALIAADSAIEYSPTDTVDLYKVMEGKTGDILAPALNLGIFYKEANGFELEEKLNFIPFNYDRAVVLVDTQVFAENEISLPASTWTYEDFEQLLKDFSKNKVIVPAYMPFSQVFVWKYFLNKSAGSWYTDTGSVSMHSEAAEDGWRALNALYREDYAKSYFACDLGAFNKDSALSWSYASQPTRGEEVHISEDKLQTIPAYRVDTLVENDSLLVLPLPSCNGTNYSFSNTDYIHGFSISSYMDSGKTDNAVKIIEFANSLEGNAILNQYYTGIPANKTLWDEDFWRRGVFAGENGDNALIGIENDQRDDFVEMFKGDPAVYEKNLRVRCIMAYYLTQQYPASGRNIAVLMQNLKRVSSHINDTIMEYGVPFGYNPKLIKEGDETW